MPIHNTCIATHARMITLGFDDESGLFTEPNDLDVHHLSAEELVQKFPQHDLNGAIEKFKEIYDSGDLYGNNDGSNPHHENVYQHVSHDINLKSHRCVFVGEWPIITNMSELGWSIDILNNGYDLQKEFQIKETYVQMFSEYEVSHARDES